MRKKGISILMCLIMVLGLVACGNSDTSSSTGKDIDIREKDNSSSMSKDVVYREIDNSCIAFDIKYSNCNGNKFSADSIEFTISEYVTDDDEFDRFEKYKETDDLLIYKIYYTDEATESYFNESANSYTLEYLEEYCDKYVEEEEKESFKEEYKIDDLKRSESAAQDAYEIYKESGSCAMQVFVGVKNTTDFYVFRDGSPAFLASMDAFLEGLIYLDSENSTDIPKDKLADIGFTKTGKCMKLGFYIPEEVSLADNESNYSDDYEYVKGIQYYGTDVMPNSNEAMAIPAMPAEEEAVEEATDTDTATTNTATTNTNTNTNTTDLSLEEPEDIDTSIEQIRTWYYATQDNLDNLLYSSCDTNLDCYFDGGYPAKVVAKSGYHDWNVTREYYYHNQELYFVFVHGDIGEYRFYIKNGLLIRSISPDGNAVDAGDEASQDTCDVYDKVIAEEEAFPPMINCGN